MPSGTNYNAFCADYSTIANCLFAIQGAEDNGSLDPHPELAQLLFDFDWGVLRRLYNRTAGILGALEGFNTSHGTVFFDFGLTDFNSDFNIGVAVDPTPGYSEYHVTYTPGDYSVYDFSEFDFSVDLIDGTNDSYSAHFQTILNMFGELCSRSAELSVTSRQGINSALTVVINEFNNIKSSLVAAGINLCEPEPVHFTNSPYLYLQAAGADGSDGVAPGIHLRWSLAGDLGFNHLPQGDHYSSGDPTTGYNRPADYITLSRTPYTDPVIFTLDLETAPPAIDFGRKQWTYTINVTADERQLSNIVLLTFTDAEQYTLLAATTDPQANYFAFLKSYNGLLEMEVQNKTAFSFACDFRAEGTATGGLLKIEALSGAIIDGALAETANIRKTIVAGTPVARILGDDMVRFRLQKNVSGFIQSVSFETYADFIGTREESAWVVIGDKFALSLTDDEVFDRLETPEYPVDDLWPQFNDGTRVKVANYHDKWTTTRPNDPSVRETVQRYLELSETDPRAEDVVRDDDAPADAPGILISYLDVINLMAMDYHLARMLGLGCIDPEVNSLEAGQYVYKISYTNLKAPGSAEVVTHEYASLPTGKTDSRLPEKPAMRPLTYGLPVGENESPSAFDSEGYMNYANIRLVNIGRKLYNFELPPIIFFDEGSAAKDYNLFNQSRSVLFGIEYRPDTTNTYSKPEITSDKSLGHVYYAYDDAVPEGVPETTPVPDNATSLYVHFEKQEGVHHYAIYGINWFSRASVLSDEAATDETVFPLRNTLLPPAGVAVQYIQKEDTLLFTTGTEQDWLAGRSETFAGQDIGLTRITFNWLDVTDISYVQDIDHFNYAGVLKPTYVKPWFRPNPPIQVAGIIAAVVPAGDDLLLLKTGSYALLDGTMVTPVIAPEDLSRFNGSVLSTPGGQFIVQSVAAGVDGPLFTVTKVVKVVNVEDDTDPNVYSTRNTYLTPEAGTRFTVTENLSTEANWLPVEAGIQLVNFTDPQHPVKEENTDDQGNITRYLLGGISGKAIISGLRSTPDDVVVPGYYSVTFESSVNLAPHPQAGLPYDSNDPGANAPGSLHPPKVDWYNGLIRVPVSAGTVKQLDVIRIVATSPLQVYIYDPGYLEEPIQLSASGTDFVDGVNFHPGYKAYLFAEPLPDHSFNGANILPSAGFNDKKTFIGLQATDTHNGGSGYVSAVSLPVILLARRIEEPVRPEMPLFTSLRVRPDAINKAAFTLDLKIAPDQEGATRNPFGVAFYRTTNEDVLRALYNPETATVILDTLDGLITDDDFGQRYGELVNLIFDPDHPGQFRVFEALPYPYGFPVPDKTGLVDNDHDTLDIKIAKYHDAIVMTLLPLTAQVPVINFVKEGKQTDKKQPTIRTADGNLLTTADAAFDPFPMIRKYASSVDPNTYYIRFTDYTLNGASRFFYFYGGAEVTNQLVPGELSPFAGPVTIVHTSPPQAPVIRFFTLGPPVDEIVPIAVSFSLCPFLPGETISKVRIYRSLDQDDTFALQSMTSFADYDIVFDAQKGIVITDTFPDLPAFPSGETFYYRLAFIRAVINENNEPEDIIGFGSENVTITLIDTVNPDAPELVYTAAENKLSWSPTSNKGTYFLYQQNSRGNWQMIYKVTPVSQTAAMEYILPVALDLTDANGNRIYYRFKVKAENSSGLMNLTDKELTI